MSTNNNQQYFLEHAKDLRAEFLDNTRKIAVLSPEQIDEAADLIRNNRLVAFPTETVYGLGANALDEKAILSVYQAKKRPLSDPIIVHILSQEQAEELVVLEEQEKKVFRVLTKAFWPGPLTFIGKANLQKIPLVVTAGTGFVGLRSPIHPIARSLIQKSGLPIGAPSANLFGHVSPTQSYHVVNDFYDQDIAVIDGQGCQLGLESTVVKLYGNTLQVLREGSLSVSKLGDAIRLNNLNLELQIVSVTRSESENQEAPGQMLKHYSPNIPCYYYQLTGDQTTSSSSSSNNSNSSSQKEISKLTECAFLSFSPSFRKLNKICKLYYDVGDSNIPSKQMEIQDIEDKFCTFSERKIMQEVYSLLRRAESSGARVIVLGWEGEKRGPIWDKISRATENKRVIMKGDCLFR